jgi:diguanylate cyclase (GGDEF)-like protein
MTIQAPRHREAKTVHHLGPRVNGVRGIPPRSARKPDRGWLLPRLLRAIEPPLDGLEAAYRRHFLKSDTDQAIIGIGLLTVPLIFFAWSDYLLFGWSLEFLLLIVLRTALLTFSATVAWHLRQTLDYRVYDRLIMLWAAGGLAAITAVNLTRPPTYTQHIASDVLVVIAGYLIIPNQLSHRLQIAGAFSLSTLALFLTGRRMADPVTANLIWETMILTNVIGFVVSTRFYRLRRQQYLARMELERVRDELEVMATVDGLTGVLNRRRFLEVAEEELSRSRRYGRPLSIIAVDLDHFKDVNDRLGHAAGDDVLSTLAHTLQDQMRRQDVVGRLGGEEFAVILPETPVSAAIELAERMRVHLRVTKLAADGDSLTVTASLGVAEVRRSDRSVEEALQRADAALYRAKRQGRDRVEAA